MKKNNQISFRLVAYTDAAGKYSPDAFRSGNEDNFYVDDDLTDSTTNRVSQDEVIQLGRLGMLMVVADGMGGMNAGEVASQIAIDTVKVAFSSDNLTDAIIATPQSRQKLLEQVIKSADKKIKSEARKDSNREGMGSTIILAWLLDDELVISWCGDSRAYLFNNKSGIRLISQDHSYVQELVNKGMLTYEQTFDHPQNNIITRSLGDPTEDAKPESRILNVGKGDIILLCSDGLSGVLRDRKTFDSTGKLYPEENLEDIIRAHTSSMKECREALWEAAERGGWYDNVTAILCQITDGPESKWALSPSVPNVSNKKFSKKRIWLFTIGSLIVIGTVVAAFFIGRNTGGSNSEEIINDTIPTIESVETEIIDDSTPKVDEPIEVKEDKPEKTGKKTIVQQKIKEQNDGVSPESDESENELTPIVKGENSSNGGTGKFTPILDNSKKSNGDNPLAPSKKKKYRQFNKSVTDTWQN